MYVFVNKEKIFEYIKLFLGVLFNGLMSLNHDYYYEETLARNIFI